MKKIILTLIIALTGAITSYGYQVEVKATAYTSPFNYVEGVSKIYIYQQETFYVGSPVLRTPSFKTAYTLASYADIRSSNSASFWNSSMSCAPYESGGSVTLYVNATMYNDYYPKSHGYVSVSLTW